MGGDEFHQHVNREYQKAKALADANPHDEKLHVNALFAIGVGDGYAHYVVIAIKGKRCKVEWRGFCPDRWTDHHFGFGGSFPVADVLRYVSRERGLKEIFSR